VPYQPSAGTRVNRGRPLLRVRPLG